MFGKQLIILGILLIFVGLILSLGNKFPFLGNLPGDIKIQKENFEFHFPLMTSILLSVLLSLFFWLFNR
jgi:hypothetical protein